MQENKENIDLENLIIKYILKECNGEEKVHVQHLIENNVEAQRYFNIYSKIYSTSNKLDNEYEYNTQKAIANFKEKTGSKKKMISMWKVALSVAATVTIVFVLINIGKKNAPEQTKISSQNETLSDTLDDGTIITLNRFSLIKYSVTNDARTIMLDSGEVFFEVAHNPDKPFVVSVDDLTVTVLGTTFNIKKSKSDSVVITVVEGTVSISGGDKSCILTENEECIYSKINSELSKNSIHDKNDLFWKTGVIDFTEANLVDVIHELEETYDMKVTIDGDFSDEELTAKFTNQSIESVMEILELTFDSEIIRLEDSSYLIRAIDK